MYCNPTRRRSRPSLNHHMNISTTNSEKHITLTDGRSLGYAEFGSPTGTPIFMFNGTSSRLFYPLDDSVAISAHARIITVERPGIGLSTFKPNRTLLDWPDDIQQLADTLGIKQFAVAGGSAGGPYAAACAFRLPERVTALAKYAPWLLTLSQSFMLRNPEGMWKQFYSRLPECDKAILQAHPNVDMKAVLLRDLPELSRQGPQGVVWDMRVLTGPWGFSPAAIKVKTHLWQGEQDVNVPLNMGRFLARAIPNCEARFIPNEGHLTYINHWQEMLGPLWA